MDSRVKLRVDIGLYKAAAQKHRACNRPGRPCCDKPCNRIARLATNLPCDKPIEDCSTLHRGLRQGFVTEGPLQRFVTARGGGTRQTPISSYTYRGGTILTIFGLC